ncbi:hypothetical protein PInf_022595 [Phytophthora infestans]|nr:hypothetical protein PInf_022595 [Phytophthora infestans]
MLEEDGAPLRLKFNVRLLSLVKQFLPLGSAQWDDVHYAYNRNLPAEWPQCDSESLRRKFYALKNAKKPAGERSIVSPEIRRAKHAFREIEDKCSVVQLDADEQETISLEPLITERQDLPSATCQASANSAGGSLNPNFGIDGGVTGGDSYEAFGDTTDQQEDGASAGSGVTPTTRERDFVTRRKDTPEIDDLLQQLAQPNMKLPKLLFVMEERAHQRELQYRQEKEAREEKREAERLRAQEARELRESERAERESQCHKMLMTMLAAAIGKK